MSPMVGSINTYLGVSDTSNRDESTTRFSMRHSYARDTVDVGVTRLSINNGYDAFSLDNTRETLSDDPGRGQSRFHIRFHAVATRGGSAYLQPPSQPRGRRGYVQL